MSIVNIYDENICISDEEIKTVVKAIITTIKKELPKEKQCGVIITDILSEVEATISRIPLDL